MEISSGNWSLQCRPEAASWLREEGLDDPARLLERPDVEVVKSKVRGKSTVRIEGRGGRSLFLKRHLAIGLRRAWRARFDACGNHSAPMREWKALLRLEQLRVSAPKPLLVAEQRRFSLVRRALLLTEALPEAESLESLLYEGLEAPRLRRILERVADALARMHEGGLNHRDFYLGHLRATAEDEIQVLDLDRADCRNEVGDRWRIKDLAALHFSTPDRLVPRALKLRFLCRYLAACSGSRDARALIPAIEEKAARIRAHVAKKLERGDGNVHLNE